MKTILKDFAEIAIATILIYCGLQMLGLTHLLDQLNVTQFLGFALVAVGAMFACKKQKEGSK